MEATSTHLGAWLDLSPEFLGSALRGGPLVAIDADRTPGTDGLWAINTASVSAVLVCPEWHDAVQRIVQSLTNEELFSVFGAYELSRATLGDDIGIWGPSWYYVATAATFAGVDCDEARRLTVGERELIDGDLFWHSMPTDDSVSFGIIEAGTLLALSRADVCTPGLWEIGLDVRPDIKGRGLGRKVFSAAAEFILQQGADVLARTAPWNVPSARLERSLGLRLQAQELLCLPAPFQVPPPPLGSPLPGTTMVNYYPDWAINTGSSAESRP